MALIAERSRANEMRHLIKSRTCENDIFFMSDRMSAILLKQMVHSLAIPPSGRKNQRGEGSMLNFLYPLSILPFLFQFVHLVERDEVLLAVGRGYLVENPNVKKGLLSFAPKVACSHIQSCFVLPVGRSQLEHLIMKWLEPWLSRDTKRLSLPGALP